MKKGLAVVLFLALVVAMISGCSVSGNKVSEDLLNYINNEIPSVASLEELGINAWASVSGENYTDDETMYATLVDQVIPNYRDFINKLEEITPETNEVREVHEIYVSAANNQMNGFIKIQTALEEQDGSLVAEANEKLEEGRKGIRDWQYALKDLAKKHKVKLNTDF